MKSISLFLFASAALTQAQPPAAGDDTRSNPVVITSQYVARLIDEARTNNPSLRAADSKVRSATFNAESIRTWEDPNGSFGGSVYSSKGFKPSEDGNLAYGVEQKLPLWNRPQLARRVAQTEVSMREAELNYRALQLRDDITKALLRAALAQRVVEIGEQDLAWIETTATAADNKYRAGQTALADTLEIQNELARQKDNLLTDRLRLAHEHFSLNRLLNRDPASTWPPLQLPPVAPAIPLSQKLLSLALQNEPKLRVLEQQIIQASASADLTRKNRLPDVSLGVEGRQYSGDGDFRSGMFTLRFSIPWLNGGKYRKEYEREDQVLMVREELHHLSVDVEASRRQAILNSDENTVRSQQALASRLSDWEAGHGTFRDILDARRMLLESELMAARAVAEEHQTLSEMLLWAGLDTLEDLLPLANQPSLLPTHPHE
jgi:outer membrane protein, heavy metal efflux system